MLHVEQESAFRRQQQRQQQLDSQEAKERQEAKEPQGTPSEWVSFFVLRALVPVLHPGAEEEEEEEKEEEEE